MAIGVAAVVGLSLAPREASAVLLSDLIARQGSVVSGDKLFDNFKLTITPITAGFYVADPAAIDVQAKTFGPDYGIQFAGPMFASSGAAVALLLEFDATVTDSTKYLHDIGLAFNGVATGSQGVTSVTETIFLPNTNTAVAQAYVAAPAPLSDHIVFSSPAPAPLQKVHVVKDIKLIAGPDGIASISFIRQSFSQVPEPGSLLMLATGVAGLLGLRRRS